jgi:hypothetical protein
MAFIFCYVYELNEVMHEVHHRVGLFRCVEHFPGRVSFVVCVVFISL